MSARRDRVELGVLGLMVLAWGLLVAPLLHSLEHGHGHRHAHGAPAQPSGSHGAGSVEHLLAVTVPAPAMDAPVVHLVRLRVEQPAAPAPIVLASRHRAEQPQGP